MLFLVKSAEGKEGMPPERRVKNDMEDSPAQSNFDRCGQNTHRQAQRAEMKLI
jgi:hypothetical protein